MRSRDECKTMPPRKRLGSGALLHPRGKLSTVASGSVGQIACQSVSAKRLGLGTVVNSEPQRTRSITKNKHKHSTFVGTAGFGGLASVGKKESLTMRQPKSHRGGRASNINHGDRPLHLVMASPVEQVA